MPKTYNVQERAYIKQRLLEEAKDCLAKYGVRKTTVDELVKRVNIPKGTFYLFYESKERLFYEVFCNFHDLIHEKMLTEIAGIKQDVTPRKLTDLIFDLYKMVGDSFLLKFITEGELEMIIRKLPPETMSDHTKKDDFSIEQLISLIPGLETGHTKIFSAALRGVFISMLHKHEIGEDLFDDAIKMMIHGVVLQMFGGEEI